MAEQVDSIEEFFNSIQDRFVPEAAKGLNFTFQYEVSGDGGGTYHAVVDDGTIEVHEGAADSPDVTMQIAADNYLKLINGKMKGQMAYLTGKMKIKGNKMLAQKMQKIVPVGK